jgi:hypothetical protein
MFRQAGCFVGRKVAVDPAVPPQHAAHAVLAEVGGLRLVEPAPSIASIAFGHVQDGAEMVRLWEDALATTMVGIAEVDDGHAELYLTDRGQVIGCSLVHDAFWLVGKTFSAAMDEISAGKRPAPMLLPGQHEVWLYGELFRPGEAGVIGPTDLA